MYLCSMKMMWYCMKMVLVAVVMMAAAGGVGAQESDWRDVEVARQ